MITQKKLQQRIEMYEKEVKRVSKILTDDPEAGTKPATLSNGVQIRNFDMSHYLTGLVWRLSAYKDCNSFGG